MAYYSFEALYKTSAAGNQEKKESKEKKQAFRKLNDKKALLVNLDIIED